MRVVSIQTLAIVLSAASACGVASAHSNLGPQAGSPANGTSLPAALQPALYAAMARDAGPAYHLDAAGCATLDSQALRACFKQDGVQFDADHASTLGLRLQAYGRGDALTQLGSVAPQIEANSVNYSHGTLTEWWKVLPVGFEQGFTLSERPQGAGDLTLELASSHAASKQGGDLAWGAMRYGKLVVTDADGRVVPATLRSEGERILIAVNDTHAKYPVVVDPLVWVEQKVTAAAGGANDEFGYSVSISGDTAVIGAEKTTVGANSGQGAAYIFSQTGGVWSEVAKLTASDGAASDNFGWSVSLSGSKALIGARGADGNKGTAYVFSGAGSTWTQEAKLVADDGVASDRFGNAVAISGDSALVSAATAAVAGNGSQGAGYVFKKSGGTWTQMGKLVAADGAGNDQLGVSVAFDGTSAVMGAPGPSMFTGAAYVFTETGGSWSQAQKLTASDGGMFSSFGSSVAVQGGTIVVGANLAGMTGAAYVFTGSGSTWTQQQKLMAADGEPGSNFGVSVALDGSTAVVGAETEGGQLGAVYLFDNVGGTWTQSQKLVAGDRAASSMYGYTVSISGSTLLVGASGLTVGSNAKQGAAYFYTAGKDGGDPVASVTPSALAMSLEVGGSSTTTLKIANAAPQGSDDLTWSIAESARQASSSFIKSRAARATAANNTASAAAILSQGSTSAQGTRFGRPIVLDATSISQMADNTPESGNGLSCGEKGLNTSENSWLRRFYFSEHGITESTTINSVTIASDEGPTIPVTINLYTIPHSVAVDTIPTAQLTLIGSGTGTIGGSLATSEIQIPGGVTVSDTVGYDLVVEYHIEGSPSAPFFPGGNATAQTHKTFIVAPECGLDDPATTDSIGFPSFHIIMVVDVEVGGTAPSDCQNPSDIPWLSATPTSGTLAAGTDGDVFVSANAGALAAGSYSANLCVTTNDPAQPLISVPVSLTVSASDAIFCSGFEDGETGACGGSSDVVTGMIDLPVTPDGDGSTFDFVTGFWGAYNGNRVDDFNLYDYGDGTLTMYLYGDMTTKPVGAVIDASGQAAVLRSGATIGPGTPISSTSNYLESWLGGEDGYLGFAFENEETGAINYGYIHLKTTGPTGFPAQVLEYAYDKSGAAIRIP